MLMESDLIRSVFLALFLVGYLVIGLLVIDGEQKRNVKRIKAKKKKSCGE